METKTGLRPIERISHGIGGLEPGQWETLDSSTQPRNPTQTDANACVGRGVSKLEPKASSRMRYSHHLGANAWNPVPPRLSWTGSTSAFA